MLPENRAFVLNKSEQQLFNSENKYKDARITPEILDYEMQFEHSRTELYLNFLTQEGLEHFVSKYGSTYKTLYFDNCGFIKDFSPLADLENITAVRIEWCRNAERLWDFSRNNSLKILSVHNAKKIVANPMLLQTTTSLEEIRFWGGGFDNKHMLESLSCFEGIKTLKRIDLNEIKLQNHNLGVLSSIPNLEKFHFEPEC